MERALDWADVENLIDIKIKKALDNLNIDASRFRGTFNNLDDLTNLSNNQAGDCAIVHNPDGAEDLFGSPLISNHIFIFNGVNWSPRGTTFLENKILMYQRPSIEYKTKENKDHGSNYLKDTEDINVKGESGDEVEDEGNLINADLLPICRKLRIVYLKDTNNTAYNFCYQDIPLDDSVPDPANPSISVYPAIVTAHVNSFDIYSLQYMSYINYRKVEINRDTKRYKFYKCISLRYGGYKIVNINGTNEYLYKIWAVNNDKNIILAIYGIY